MSPFAVFNIQTTFSLLLLGLIAKWYIVPWAKAVPKHVALVPLLMVHAFRYTPLTLLVPGQVSEEVPTHVASTIAYGDLTSSVLAILTMLLVRYRRPAAFALAWLFTVVGIADIVVAIGLGVSGELYQLDLGFNWYILNYYVPMLIVSHLLIIWRLRAAE